MRLPESETKAAVLEPGSVVRREAWIAIGVVAFAFLTAAGAHLRVPLPFTPVPVTLQVFFVLLCAGVMGPGWGAVSQLLYVGLGAAGLPMFSAGAGFAHLLGPTGGYIVGFIAAQPAVGLILGKGGAGKASQARTAAAMLAGIAVIYAFGVIQLKTVTGMNFGQAFVAGVLPFVTADLLKAFVAWIIVNRMK